MPEAPARRPTRGGSPAPTRERQDRRVVISLVTAFVIVALIGATYTLQGSFRTSDSKAALTQSLDAVSRQQVDFRVINQRFASWDELMGKGMALPPSQRVVSSNTSGFHWYVSLKDVETGVICERLGGLMDPGGEERPTNCREPAR